jgi:cytochrome c5
MQHLFKIFLFMTLFATSAVASADFTQVLSEQNVAVFTKGQAIYNKHCIACHIPSNIMVASPKFGDREDWGTRLTANKNLKGLVQNALKGKAAMPPKGLCLECKSKDLEAAIVYMMKGN